MLHLCFPIKVLSFIATIVCNVEFFGSFKCYRFLLQWGQLSFSLVCIYIYSMAKNSVLDSI